MYCVQFIEYHGFLVSPSKNFVVRRLWKRMVGRLEQLLRNVHWIPLLMYEEILTLICDLL